MSLTTTRRFTIDEYHRLINIGFFYKNERIELIRGELVGNLRNFTLLIGENLRLGYQYIN
jgi:hypothetical protein